VHRKVRLFAQVETNQPGGARDFVWAASARSSLAMCGVCWAGSRCPPQQAAEMWRVYEE
jgi:hypothetical protein